MSAYIEDKAHFDAILATVIDMGGDGASWYIEGKGRTYITRATATETGQILLTENIKSVQYRYSDDSIDNLPGPSNLDPTYQYEPGRILTLPELFKALDGLEYQSCEHPGWDASEAYAIVNGIRDFAWCHLPGYEAADTWSISDPAPTVEPERVTYVSGCSCGSGMCDGGLTPS